LYQFSLLHIYNISSSFVSPITYSIFLPPTPHLHSLIKSSTSFVFSYLTILSISRVGIFHLPPLFLPHSPKLSSFLQRNSTQIRPRTSRYLSAWEVLLNLCWTCEVKCALCSSFVDTPSSYQCCITPGTALCQGLIKPVSVKRGGWYKRVLYLVPIDDTFRPN